MSYERYRVLKYYSMHDRCYKWAVYDLEMADPKTGETMIKVTKGGTSKEARSKAKEINTKAVTR